MPAAILLLGRPPPEFRNEPRVGMTHWLALAVLNAATVGGRYRRCQATCEGKTKGRASATVGGNWCSAVTRMSPLWRSCRSGPVSCARDFRKFRSNALAHNLTLRLEAPPPGALNLGLDAGRTKPKDNTWTSWTS